MVSEIVSFSGLIAFVILVAEKNKFFEWWGANVLARFGYQDVCYFCFCAWMAIGIGIVTKSLFIIPAIVVISRIFVKIILDK